MLGPVIRLERKVERWCGWEEARGWSVSIIIRYSGIFFSCVRTRECWGRYFELCFEDLVKVLGGERRPLGGGLREIWIVLR